MARILAVEDEAELRDLLKEELESEGHEVVTASDGEDALARLANFTPDIVVSDVSMPGIDGFDLLEKFRAAYPASADTPFLFLTALASREDELRAREHGIDDYLTKPVDFDMLHSVLATRLRQVARMRERKERQMVKLYTRLSGSPPPRVGSERVATAYTAPDDQTLASELDLEISGGDAMAAAMASLGETECPAMPEDDPAAGEAAPVERRVLGSLLRFPNLRAVSDAAPGGKSLYARTIERTVAILKALVCEEAVVTDTRDGDVVVAYRTEDEGEAGKLGEALARDLPGRIINDRHEEMSRDFELDDATIENALLVSAEFFEIVLERNPQSPEAFEKAIYDVIEKTRINTRAPNLLVSAIRRERGYLSPLELYARNGTQLPIRFFNYDIRSVRKMRAGFAFFGPGNTEKARYLVDVLTLDLMEDAARGIGPKDIAVIDMHYDTLASRIYAAAYARKFLHFAEHTPYAFMINVRSVPLGLGSKVLGDMLRPLGKHANRRSIQIHPQELGSFAHGELPVSCLVCTRSKLAGFPEARDVFPRHKPALAKAGTLLVLRGLKDKSRISKFNELGFDGYAIDPDGKA